MFIDHQDSSLAYANLVERSEEIALLRQLNHAPFVVQVCHEVFQGGTLFQAAEADVLISIKRIQRAINATTEEPRYTRSPEEYLSGWKKNTDQSPAWFGTARNEVGENMISLLPATKNVLSFIESLTINKSMISMDVLSDFTDFISETADRLTGRVDDRKQAIEAKIRKLQKELAVLDDSGIATLDEREKKTRANKFRKMIMDIRTGVGEIPDALKGLSEECFDILFSTRVKGDVLNDVGALRREFREGAPYRIMSTLRQTHLTPNRRVVLEDNIQSVVQGVKEYLTTDDIRYSKDFFKHIIDVGEKHLDKEAAHQGHILEFIRSKDFMDQQEEALLFRDARSLFKQIAVEVAPSSQDKRMEGVGLRHTDFGAFAGPEHTRRRLSRGPALPRERAKHDPIAKVDRERQKQESAERNKRNARMSKILSKETIHARVEKQLEGGVPVSISKYLKRYPLEYGLSEFHVILEAACKQLPSQFTPGNTTQVEVKEGEAVQYLETADFEFLLEGNPGQGLHEFALQFSADQLEPARELYNFTEMDLWKI